MELYWIYAVLTAKRAKKLKQGGGGGGGGGGGWAINLKKATPPPPPPKKKKLGLTCGNAVKLFSFLSKRALNVLFFKEVRLW